ncbi:MAG TPA: membrane dipeptidase [Polyangiaceae bacterium]|nr:membrane dipeptidase [Polyangiaceae bacterium]
MIPARDADGWSRELGISREAVELYLASEVVDLHLDSFIWKRLFGYDLARRHARPPLAGWFLGHADFPRVREAGVASATWVITTNPLRDAPDRTRTLFDNLTELKRQFAALSEELCFTRTHAEYVAARHAGKHAAFIGIQGGNALDGSADAVERLAPLDVLRVTLVHLSNSSIGQTSSPLRAGADGGLSRFGRELVERLEHARIFVDLAHISRRGFWDAVEVHDRTLPLLVTHTGVSSVHRHWRNLDDSQIRAIAASGGVIGIMYHSAFLGPSLARGRAEWVVDHIEHVVRLVGEDYVALGSDFDGAIVPPRNLTSILELPRLVELMLGRGFGSDVIRKVLGQNFLRVLAQVRP